MNPRLPLPGVLPALLLGLLAAPAGRAADAPDPKGVAFFEQKIRPVLVTHCYGCHSAEAQAKKKLRGGLLLDTRQGLLAGGDSGPALVPGKPKDSPLLQSLTHKGDVKMPPKGRLPAAVLADFTRWVEMGAPDPRAGAVAKQRGLSLEEGRAFWAYRPVARPAVPAVKGPAAGAVDAFLLAALEAKGLAFAPEADRPTLIRRLTFDLTGLPPTPDEVAAFAADASPDAYARLVDRLLASPAFGERWGRHWLDVARFGESLTLRGFVLPEAWRYRDYVIDAFDRDAPFDRFVREQVAGDLLPADSLEARRRQMVASTFLALGNTNLEEQDKKQLRMDVVDEQLDTLGKAFLAQTIGCARCHDHKFDPVPTKDYYALAGILRNTRTLTHANVSMWLALPLPADPGREKALRDHETQLATLQKQVTGLKAALAKAGKGPAKAGVVALTDLPGIVVDDTRAKKVGAWKDSKSSTAYVGAGYVHDENAGKGEKTITFQPEIPKSGKYEVRFAYTPGTNRAAKVPVTVFSADGEKTLHIDQREAPPLDGHFVSLGEYTFEKSGQGFVIVATEGTTGHVIADAVQFLPAGGADARPAREAKPAPAAPKGGKPATDADRLRDLEARLKTLQTSGPKRDLFLGVSEEPVIEDARVHVRGSVHNQGEPAPRGFLRVATPGTAPALPAKESGRRELAAWLASADNPLTARVMANRAWHWLFGAGLVRTVDNFGTTGEKPSHPELLDHLAAEFVADGWSVKGLVRQIVLSRAYRQGAAGDARLAELDPENRLLGRAPRRRLEAEALRDAMLAVSGQLDRARGGPTFKPGLASDYNYRHDDARRSVYAPVFRNALPDLFEAFDFADPSVTTGRRNVSTVVPQALFLMNHPFVLEQARLAARRLLAEPGLDDPARLDRACRLALGRPPLEAERRLLGAYLTRAGSAGREAAWTQVVQVLFASADFRSVD